MFGMAAFLFMHDSFSFLESMDILTNLSFFMDISASEIQQFSVVPSAFSRFPFSIYFSNSCSTLFWKWIGTGLPFCWMGLTPSFTWISIVRPSIVWLFLNRPPNSSRVFVLLSSTVMFRIMFVFRLPCNPISSLSNQSMPSNVCVSLFSIIRIGNITLLFFRFDFYQCLAIEFYRIFVKVYEAF